MILEKSTKRLCIYYFYDIHGKFDNIHSKFLSDIKKHCEDVIFIYKNNIDDKSLHSIKQLCCKTSKLNDGYKQHAYKQGFDMCNFNKYDEILFADSKIIGPFCDASELFNKMTATDIDFWGLCYNYAHKSTTSEFLYYAKKKPFEVKKHIKLDFFAVRSNMFKSADFKAFFSKLKHYKTEGKTTLKFDLAFTEYFENKGYSHTSFINFENQIYCTNPLLDCSYLCLKNQNAPFLNCEIFYRDLDRTLEYSLGQDIKHTIEHIDKDTDYDINHIYDYILRVANQHDIKNALELSFIVPKDYDIPKTDETVESLALCMHLYYEDLFDYSLDYAKSMPEYADVFITTNNETKKKQIEDVFSHLQCNKLDVRVIGNKGRDVSALLIGLKDVLRSYDIICFVHDKKTTQFNPNIVGETFSYQCFENTLASKNFVNNVIEIFKSNKRLGTLSPTIPFHGQMFSSIGRDWTLNFDNTVKLAKKHNITVDISEDKPPVAPLGTMFWLRGKALEILIDDDMTYDDYPKEPNGTNGTMLHAYERLYSYAAQQSGYFAAQVMSDEYAKLQTAAHYHMLRKIGYKLFSEFDLECDSYNAILHYLDSTVDYIPKQSLYKRIKLYLYLNLDNRIVKFVQNIKKALRRKG